MPHHAVPAGRACIVTSAMEPRIGTSCVTSRLGPGSHPTSIARCTPPHLMLSLDDALLSLLLA